VNSTTKSKHLADLIVADASPLIVLARAGHLQILALVAGKVIVPDVVVRECTHDRERPGARVIEQAFAKGWLSRQPQSLRFESVNAAGLGPGEAAAIGLALALRSPLLIDERIGRQVAAALALKVIGTIGILLLAKQRSLITAIRPVIDSLKREGFFIAPALELEILQRAGETANRTD
jgi:uncharacterized protein